MFGHLLVGSLVVDILRPGYLIPFPLLVLAVRNFRLAIALLRTVRPRGFHHSSRIEFVDVVDEVVCDKIGDRNVILDRIPSLLP